MSIQFQIEYIVKDKDHPHIIAKLLSKDINFRVPKKSYLGEIEIEEGIIQPRALDHDGEPRFDLFIFIPKEKNKLLELKKGMILNLLQGDEMGFLEPWCKTDLDFSIELKKEINIGHILYNKEVKTIARRQDNDDVLFEVLNSDFKYAKVHLTWTGNLQGLPYPNTTIYNDWNEVYDNLILKDNKDWEK